MTHHCRPAQLAGPSLVVFVPVQHSRTVLEFIMGNCFSNPECVQCGISFDSAGERDAHQPACVTQALELKLQREERARRQREERNRQARECAELLRQRQTQERAERERLERIRQEQARAERAQRLLDEEELRARTCVACGRTFQSPAVLAHHVRSEKHARRVRAIEAQAAKVEKARVDAMRVYRAREAKVQADALKVRRQAESLDPPYPGIEGYWELRENCPTTLKSFAFYECTITCRKRWSTAHGFQKFKQGCKKCNTEVFPKFMWINTGSHTSRDRNDTEESKPHDYERCEACQRGMCLAAQRDRHAGGARGFRGY